MADKKVEEHPTYSIKEVEVFSAGVWNKDKYELSDLLDMVTAFENLKEGFKPYLKLGHDDSQKLAKSSGLPAMGWVERLYVRGEKLYADFSYIPKTIFNLIKAKAYRKVSCEIYWNMDVNGNKYPRVLGAIALLGAETPGVLNLKDILSNYAMMDNSIRVFNETQNQDNFKSYEIKFNADMEGDKMSEEQNHAAQDLEKVQADLEEQKKSYAKVQSDLDAKSKEVETIQAELAKFRDAALKAEAEAATAKVAKFVTELEAQKLSTPAMKDLVTELMSDKKEYTVKEKTISKEEIIKEILTLSNEAAKVNFSESSRADFAKNGDKEKCLADKIEKYSQDNKVSYAQAYKAVMKGEKPMDEEMKDKKE